MLKTCSANSARIPVRAQSRVDTVDGMAMRMATVFMSCDGVFGDVGGDGFAQGLFDGFAQGGSIFVGAA